jgi:toxin ParE1/3/4
MKLRIDPAAKLELAHAAGWYEDRRRGLGLEFLAVVDAALQTICGNPLRCAHLETLPEEPGVRRVLLNRFPYAIVFEVAVDEVWILAIAHTRRRPGYWHDRRSPTGQ